MKKLISKMFRLKTKEEKRKIRKALEIKNKRNLTVGEGTVLLEHTTFRHDVGSDNKITIGKDCMLNCNFVFESDKGEIEIGDRVFINGGTSLISRSKITFGNDITVAWGCTFYDHNSHSLDWKERQKDLEQQIADYKKTGNFIENKNWEVVKSRPIKICDKVWIGFDCTILNGVTIGEGAVIGAKSVVREDVEPWTVVAGNPAKLIKRVEKKD